MKLFTRYLNSTAVRAPENEGGTVEKTDAEKQREEISVEVGSVSQQEDDQNKTDNENEEDKNDDADKEKENDDDDDDDSEEEQNDENETEEQKKERVARAKQERKDTRLQRRIDRITAEANAAKAENERLKQQLAENPVEGLTEEEVERRAEEKARVRLAEQQAKDAKKAFEDKCENLAAEATKTNKDFVADVNTAAQEVGPFPDAMINILTDLDNKNGGDVLNYLIKNIDDYEDIRVLSEARMTQRLLRISDKIKEESKPKPRIRPNLPAPIEAINGKRSTSTVLTGNESTEDFIRLRNQQVEERRKAKGY